MDLSEEDGADSVERDGDHPGSPYFSQIDFYNLESTDTLTILPKFKTMQQTSEWSCGVTASLMVMNYFDKLDQFNEPVSYTHLINVNPNPYFSANNSDFLIYPNSFSRGMYGSVIDPVPIIHRLRFLFKESSSNSTAFCFTSISSNL